MSDSIQATALTVDSEGHVGAEFTGHVTATGLDLLEAPTEVPAQTNYVAWKDAAQIMQEGIAGSRSKFSRFLQLLCGPNDIDPAKLTLTSGAPSNVVASAGLEDVATLINSLGQSSFPRRWRSGIPKVEDLRFNFGTFALTYVAFETESNEIEILHGLEKVPSFVGTCQFSEEGARTVDLKVLNRDTESFEVIGQASAAFPSTVAFEYGWFAIG